MSNLKTNSYVPDGLQTESVLSCEIIFGTGMAHNGFFLCTADMGHDDLRGHAVSVSLQTGNCQLRVVCHL